jgi:hypothetical protein
MTPVALTPAERLARADRLLAEARTVTLPPAGQARGHLLVHKRSLLGRALALVAAMTHTRYTIGRDATPAERDHASRIGDDVEREWPAVLDR